MKTLQMILEEDRLNIRTEMELFEAVERWTKNECERLGELTVNEHVSRYPQNKHRSFIMKFNN